MSMSVDLFLYPCLSLVSVLDDSVGPERSVEHVKCLRSIETFSGDIGVEA